MKRSGFFKWLVPTVAAGVAACTPIAPSYVTLPANGTMNADSVRNVWGALPVGPAKQFMRRGLNCGGCLVPVNISPVADEQTFDPANPPTAPRAVAHVVNTGTVATEMYGFEPNADDYLAIARDSVGAPVWVIVNIPKSANGSVTLIKGHGVQGCHHPKASKAAAAFQTCDGAMHPSMRPTMRQLAARGMNWIVANVLRLRAEDPAWIACADGCCTMDSAS